MAPLSSFIVASLAATALARPTEKRNTQTIRTVAVQRTPRHPAYHLAKAYKKYNQAVPQHVLDASTGTVSVQDEQYDQAYLAPVQLGGNTFNLDLDTGSADLWVASTELPQSEQGNHNLYQPNPNNQQQGATWQIQYGDGSTASGDVYTDTVEIGGVSLSGQPVEAAQTVSSEFVNDPSDGLFGIGLNQNTINPGEATVVSNLWPTLAEPIIGVALGHNQAGEYDLGYTNNNLYTGDITTVPVDSSQGFFSFSVGDATSNGQSLGSVGSAIGDTGTSLMLLPNSIVDNYWGQVSGATYDNNQGGYVFDCNAQLPDITLDVGGYSATVPGAYMNYAPADGSNCFGGLQYGQDNLNILGDVFLKSQYVVFNYQAPSFGIAQRS